MSVCEREREREISKLKCVLVLQARGTQLDLISSRSRHPSTTSRRVNTRRWRGNPVPPAPAPYPGFLVHFL